MTFIQVKGAGSKVWSEEETRRIAAKVFRWLRDRKEPATIGETMTELRPLSVEEVLHAIMWMRGQGVKIVIDPGELRSGRPSVISLEKS